MAPPLASPGSVDARTQVVSGPPSHGGALVVPSRRVHRTPFVRLHLQPVWLRAPGWYFDASLFATTPSTSFSAHAASNARRSVSLHDGTVHHAAPTSATESSNARRST